MTRVLILGPETPYLRSLAVDLRRAGQTSERCEPCDLGVERLRHFDAVVVDWKIGALQASHVCRRVRASVPLMAIVAVGERVHLRDKLTAFMAGADDYVANRIRIEELLARIGAMLQRSTPPSAPRADDDAVSTARAAATSRAAAPIELQFQDRVFTVRGRAIQLTLIEARIVRGLVRRRGKPVARAELRREVWRGTQSTGGSLNVHLANLRKKLASDAWMLRTSRAGVSLACE